MSHILRGEKIWEIRGKEARVIGRVALFEAGAMHFVGLAGMPRRIPDYALQFADFNQIASMGAFLFGFSQVFFLFIVIKTIRGGKQATDEVWESPEGLEWTIPSPAPYHTFSTPPAVK